MTREWYKENGYHVGLEGTQEVIDRAEREVKAAYVEPILPNADYNKDDVKKCLADLAFMRVLQINLYVTRSGAKEKLSTHSSSPSNDSRYNDQGRVAAAAVDRLRAMPGANAQAHVDDICQLFFVSNYFYQ